MATGPASSRAYLGLGSNLGTREQYLRDALRRLSPQARISALSPLYETEPWGVAPQPPFLNAVASVETALAPGALLDLLKGIERAVGRNTTLVGAPREVDLDLLLYGGLVLDEPGLVVPHPRLHLRAFVLAPLADLAPDVVVPGIGRRVTDLLAALSEPERAGVRVVARDWLDL